MELTQEEKMMLTAKQQIMIREALHGEKILHNRTEAEQEIHELRQLLQLARGHINFLLYDYNGSGKKLIQSDLLKIATYLEGDKKQ